MPVRDDFEAEIDLLKGLRSLTSAYEEIAVMRIGRIRDRVLATRSFREGLFGVFSEVRASRHQEIERLLIRRRPSPSESSKQRGKVAVLLSSNQRLSGSIVSSVMRRFEEHIEQQIGDVAIVGRVGRDHFATTMPELKFTFFELPEDDAPMLGHKELVNFLRQYREVSIFYGKFVNVVDQVAATTRLAQNRSLASTIRAASTKKANDSDDQADYLFEPELDRVLDFFDTQLFAMLFRQTVSESSLAHLGSRITAMEAASGTIEERYNNLIIEQRRARRKLRNKKQRQMLAGMTLWDH